MDMRKVGGQIAELRKNKNLTQADLGERLGVTFQAVSKWERGETLPDTAVLPDLADVLETTVDYILLGGERAARFSRRVTVDQVREGVDCLARMGELLGRDSLFYRGAVEGIDRKMNLETEKCLADPYAKEALIAEAAIQCIMAGAYLDLSDIQKGFSFQHWRDTVSSYARKYGMK